MTWLYYMMQPWGINGKSAAQRIYLRATDTNEDGEEVVSNMVEIYLFAMDFYFDLPENPMNTPLFQRIYFEELQSKPYFIEVKPIEPEEGHLMQRAIVYLKLKEFDEETVLSFVKSCFTLWEFPYDDFKESDMGDFPELNAVLSLFSMGNVKAMEDKLGKDWWKKDKE